MTGFQRVCDVVQIVCVLLQFGNAYRPWMSTDDLENHISPDDLREFMKMYENASNKPILLNYYNETSDSKVVDCFGLGPIMKLITDWLFDKKMDPAEKINTHFYFSSRKKPNRVQVFPGKQFGLEWVDFKPTRKSVVIVHGFMSHSNSSWMRDMTKAFLKWGNVNVIAVDWSEGGNTWNYAKAVANTRQVGSDVTLLLQQLKNKTGANFKDFHFVGHSLGAHICGFASYFLGGVSRITGLDPAQPCFRTANTSERLDPSDADFVDVIHTNGRLLSNIGLGYPEPTGHADFYPNGGMKQPGCRQQHFSDFFARLLQSICSHGRAYLIFTESLVNTNCSFEAYRWDLTYEGVNNSMVLRCDRNSSCSEMGIHAMGGNGHNRARGTYILVTNDKEPYCPMEKTFPEEDLLRDLREGFRLDNASMEVTSTTEATKRKKKKWWQNFGVG